MHNTLTGGEHAPLLSPAHVRRKRVPLVRNLGKELFAAVLRGGARDDARQRNCQPHFVAEPIPPCQQSPAILLRLAV